MMFGGGLLLVAVVFTVILLLLGSKGCGTSKAEGDEVEAVLSAEATEAPTAEPTPTPESVPSVDISDINSRSGILVRLSDGKVVAEKDADAKIRMRRSRSTGILMTGCIPKELLWQASELEMR